MQSLQGFAIVRRFTSSVVFRLSGRFRLPISRRIDVLIGRLCMDATFSPRPPFLIRCCAVIAIATAMMICFPAMGQSPETFVRLADIPVEVESQDGGFERRGPKFEYELDQRVPFNVHSAPLDVAPVAERRTVVSNVELDSPPPIPPTLSDVAIPDSVVSVVVEQQPILTTNLDSLLPSLPILPLIDGPAETPSDASVQGSLPQSMLVAQSQNADADPSFLQPDEQPELEPDSPSDSIPEDPLKDMQFEPESQETKLPNFDADREKRNWNTDAEVGNVSKPIWIPETPELDRKSSFWWNQYLAGSILGRETIPISSNSLAVETLQHSPTVELLAARPHAVRTTITEEAARFDWSVFIESRWRDTTEPIGSSLTTGGPGNVFRNDNLTNEVGVRKTTRFGGDLRVGQLFSHERSNSQFFIPQDQGATTLTIDYTQPLLRGAGRQVNESTIVLASLASDSADMEFVGQIQDTLADVSASYWQLYLARATLLIERRLYHRATKTLSILKKREKVDASKELISRANLALASRKSRLINARRAVLDQQTLLRTTVNSPNVDNPSHNEFVPMELPAIINAQLSVEDAFATALHHRPEVTSTLKQIEAARVRHQVSENDLLPELNLVLQTYAQGLRGDFDIQRAFQDQFEGAEPSYSAGLLFEVPIGRRAANARLTRRQIEIAEITAQFRVEMQRILFDVITELRGLDTSRRTLQTNQQALAAATDTLRLLETRHKLLSGEQDRNSSLRLQDILNSHVRVSDAEIAVVQSQIEHSLATIRLRRALGVLVRPTI